jgi:hypothetical protein
MFTKKSKTQFDKNFEIGEYYETLVERWLNSMGVYNVEKVVCKKNGKVVHQYCINDKGDEIPFPDFRVFLIGEKGFFSKPKFLLEVKSFEKYYNNTDSSIKELELFKNYMMVDAYHFDSYKWIAKEYKQSVEFIFVIYSGFTYWYTESIDYLDAHKILVQGLFYDSSNSHYAWAVDILKRINGHPLKRYGWDSL